MTQNLDYSKRNQFLPKNDTQKSGSSQKIMHKNPGIAPKGTQKSGSNPKKVPKIMAHPHIATYASYPPPRAYFQVLSTQLKQKISVLKLWVRIQRYTAVDFQVWSKMIPKIKMVYTSILRSRFQKIL